MTAHMDRAKEDARRESLMVQRRPLTTRPFEGNEDLLKLKSRLNHPAGKARNK